MTCFQAGKHIRMWEGGPLRQFSETRVSSYVSYSSPIMTGFAGSYICDACQRACKGVRRMGEPNNGAGMASRATVGWLCGTCIEGRKVRTPRERQVAVETGMAIQHA